MGTNMITWDEVLRPAPTAGLPEWELRRTRFGRITHVLESRGEESLAEVTPTDGIDDIPIVTVVTYPWQPMAARTPATDVYVLPREVLRAETMYKIGPSPAMTERAYRQWVLGMHGLR